MRPKVLFVTAWYPTHASPLSGIFIREHARAAARQAKVVVIHLAGASLAGPADSIGTIEEEGDAELSAGIPTFHVRHPRPLAWRMSFALSTVSLARAMGHVRALGFTPDLIHAHIYTAGASAVLVKPIHRRPVLVSEHSSALATRSLSFVERMKARLAFRGACRVLPASRALQTQLETNVCSARFRVIPNAVDPQVFGPRAPRLPDPIKRILFAGRMTPVKGVDDLIAALAALAGRRQDWIVDIVGDDPLNHGYARQATEVGLAERVRFHGAVSKTVLAGMMRVSDFLVLPSRWETLSCVLIEAMTVGLPVVATRAGGPADLVDPTLGYLVEPNDVQGLTQALDSMLDSYASFDAKQIRDKAAGFSLESVGDALAETYRECLTRRVS
jgi:glycosyltransferase involved in cell wall biosynthesis